MGNKKVFISYPSKSRGEMSLLAGHLEKRKIASIWRDDERIKPGDIISEELKIGCRESDCCVLVLTEHTEESKWCMQEVGAFWGANKPIIVYRTKPELRGPDLFADRRMANSLEEVAEAVAGLPPSTIPLVKEVFGSARAGRLMSLLGSLAGQAKRRIILIGTGLQILGEPQFTQRILGRAAAGKCKVLEVYLGDPWSPAVETRIIEENLGEVVPPPVGNYGILNRAEGLAAQWKQYQSPNTKFEVKLFTHYPTFALLIFDDDYFIYPYGCTRLGDFSPVFQLAGNATGGEKVRDFLEEQYRRVKESSTSLRRLESHGKVKTTLDSASLKAFGLYYVPAADSPLYRFGTKILGYNVRERQELGSKWQKYLGGADAYGFHLTICDALYFLSEGEMRSAINEIEFVASEFEPFILSDLQVKRGFPDDRSISLVPTDSSGSLEALHHEFVQRVYRRAVASNYTLGLAKLARDSDRKRANLMIERYLAPYILSRFKPHFTLLTNVRENQQGAIRARLARLYEEDVGNVPVQVDKLAIMSKSTPTSRWEIKSEIDLGRFRHTPSARVISLHGGS